MSMFENSPSIFAIALATFLLMPAYAESVKGAASTPLLLNDTLPSSLSLTHKPRRGQSVSADKNTIVSRDGEGLPGGSGSTAEGKLVYAARCESCHGVDGRQPGNVLVGGKGSLATAQPLKTVGSYWPYATTLYDYIARAMPYGHEKSLSADEVYAVAAYVLLLNEVVPVDTRLDQHSLPLVIMPNREGFIELQAQ
jgi:cytochrome c5